MKIINLDELELKCLEFGLANNFFRKEDLGKDNLFTIRLKGTIQSKTIEIYFNYLNQPLDSSIHLFCNKPLSFTCKKWEEVYWEVNVFFRDYWNYVDDKNKIPLYMKINEAINNHSKNGYVKTADVFNEIGKEL